MTNRRDFLVGSSAFGLATVLGHDGFAEESWIELSDDPSRAALFQLVIDADIRENGPPVHDLQETYAVYDNFNFPNDVGYDRLLGKNRLDAHFGIDISRYQPDIDVSLLRTQGVEFVYVKASQGSRGYDKKFDRHWKSLIEAQKHDVSRVAKGAYHFLTPDADGAAQALHFLSVVKNSGDWSRGDLVPVVDVEWTDSNKPANDAWRTKKPAEIIQVIFDWLKTVETNTSGSRPMIYTARSWWETVEPTTAASNLQLPPKLSPYSVRIADRGDRQQKSERPRLLVGSTAPLWQFTNSAKLTSGYNDAVDASVFFGTVDQFKATLTI